MTYLDIINAAIEYWMNDGDIDIHFFSLGLGKCYLVMLEDPELGLYTQKFNSLYSAARWCLLRLIEQNYFELHGDIDKIEAMKLVGMTTSSL